MCLERGIVKNNFPWGVSFEQQVVQIPTYAREGGRWGFTLIGACILLLLPSSFKVNAPINCFPHYPPLGLHRGKAGGFSSVLNGRRAPRVGNLTLEVVKSPHNPL